MCRQMTFIDLFLGCVAFNTITKRIPVHIKHEMNTENLKFLSDVARDVRKEHEEDLAKGRAAIKAESIGTPPEESPILEANQQTDDMDAEITAPSILE